MGRTLEQMAQVKEPLPTMRPVYSARKPGWAMTRHPLSWFVKRIGKRIYRVDGPCYSFKIEDAETAGILSLQQDVGYRYADRRKKT